MTGRSLGIRGKTFLALAASLGLGTIVLVGASSGFLLDGYLRAETAQMHQEAEHVAGHLAFLVHDLSEYAAEYSAWDDTADYLTGQNPEYFTDNFTFGQNDYRVLSLVAILDARGAVVAGLTYDEASDTYGALPREFLDQLRLHPELHAHADPTDDLTGLMTIGGAPLALASRPVVRNYFVGPIQGTLLIGVFLDDRLLQRLGITASRPIHVYTLADPDLPATVQKAVAALRGGERVHISRTDDRNMSGYLLLSDLFGVPAYALRLDLPRNIYLSGLLSLKILLVAIGVVVLTTGGGYLLLLEKSVLRRVIRLGDSVRRVGEGAAPAAGIVVEGGDEIAELAARVCKTLEMEQRLKGELEESARALEQRVTERTQDLKATVDALDRQIEVRRRTEEELRALERQQRAVFDNMVSCLLTFDEEHLITGVNPSALGLLKLAPSCVGRPLERTLPERLAAELLAAFRSNAPIVRCPEARISLPGGRELIVEYLLSRIPAAEGRRAQAIVLLRDLTAEKRLASEQQRLNRLTMLGEFSAQLAHELGNPLTAMSSSVQYLSAGRTEQEREPLRIIAESVQRMEGVIRRMRLLSREMPLSRALVDLGSLLGDLTQFLGRTAAQQDVRVLLSRPRRPVLAPADPAQLHQALLNLMMNALQAMPRGGTVRVRLALGRAPEGGGPPPALIVIADNGPGIPPEIAGRIFDPFYTTREDGTGLGLPIADKIVRGHGGSIRFTSRPGDGATFAVILPAAALEEPWPAS